MPGVFAVRDVLVLSGGAGGGGIDTGNGIDTGDGSQPSTRFSAVQGSQVVVLQMAAKSVEEPMVRFEGEADGAIAEGGAVVAESVSCRRST